MNLLRLPLEIVYLTVRVPFPVALTRVSGVNPRKILGKVKKVGMTENRDQQKVVLPKSGRSLRKRLHLEGLVRIVVYVVSFVCVSLIIPLVFLHEYFFVLALL